MRPRYAAAALALYCFTFNSLSTRAADDPPDSALSYQGASRPPSFDGWRRARTNRIEIQGNSDTGTADETNGRSMALSRSASGARSLVPQHVFQAASSRARFSAAAQSPDDDPVADHGPEWSYPAAQRPGSVPVPGYRAPDDLPHRDPRPQHRPVSRSHARTAASHDATDYFNVPAGYQESVRPFHSSPFDEPGASCPIDGPGTSPCRSDPFDDACRYGGDLYSDYSWDNIYFFGIGEAFKLANQNTRGAARFGFNWGLPVIDDGAGLGVQLGLSGSVAEEAPQYFATAGLFYRGDMRYDSAWNIGAVFDWMNDDEFESHLGQVRAKTSITIDRKNEIGVWGAASLIDDEKDDVPVETVDQANLFYRYLFDSDWDITAWVGWRTAPDSVALGVDTYTPINDRWAGVFGAYYAFEGDTWNVYSGLVRHWCDRARQDYLGQDRHQPYLPVADNTSMTQSIGQ